MTFDTGTKLGRFEIRSKIGEGGMGEVYLALDTELDRTVAIKILPAALASDPQRLQRFIQEAKAAEREFKRAIELDPNYVFAHHQYGWLLALSGRQTEAANELARAAQLDPRSPLVTVDNNVTYVFSKQYDRGLVFAQKGEEMDPNFFLAHFVQGWIYDKKGDYQKAIAKLQRAQQLEDEPWISCWLGHAYAASGDRHNAQKIINDFSELSKRRYVSPY